MIRNVYTRLIVILVIMALALWIDLNDYLTIYNPFTDQILMDRKVTTQLGLDLRGGLQVLLEADLPEDGFRAMRKAVAAGGGDASGIFDGGAVLGHAAGADGARLVVSLVHALRHGGGSRGTAVAGDPLGGTVAVTAEA